MDPIIGRQFLRLPAWSFAPLLTAFILSCQNSGGSPESEDSGETNQVITGQSTSTVQGRSYQIPVPVSVELEASSLTGFDEYAQGFSLLAAASAYTVSLEGCASGVSATVTESSSSIDVYMHDRDCIAKLTSFTFSGKTYVPSSGDPFTTWANGDTAIFEESGTPSNTRNVEVVANLQSPVTASDTINYRFTGLTKGPTNPTGFLGISVGAQGQLTTGGGDAPYFIVRQIEWVGQGSSNEAELVFTLECNSLISGDICESIDMNDISYSLVEDIYAGAPTHGQCDTETASATSLSISTEKLSAGQSGITNGGFFTNNSSNILKTPSDMVSTPNLILIIKSTTNQIGFQYFNIDINLSN